MRKCLLPMICLLLTGFALQAQSASGGDLLKQLQIEGDRGRVTIRVDSLLKANYYKLLTSNSEIKGVPGYRIRIFSESGLGAKEEQQKVRARFLSLYPGIDAYYSYDEPYFKVYVGDCRTRSEALKLYDRISKNFPNAILREDYINIK
jgi:hypothetical protein